MARGRHYAKLSLSNAARLSFSDLCILLFMFLSLCRLCVCVFLCSHWSLVDVPLIFFCPADHVPDWQPRVLLGMVEARSVNVKKTTTTTTTNTLNVRNNNNNNNPQLPPVIGAPWGLKKNLNAFVSGTLRGYFLPVRYGSVGVQLTRLRALYQGTLTSGCVWKNLNTSYLYNAAILASFFFIRVFKGVLSSEFVD